MSTERSSFGLNSILPSGYRSKAEAFAKSLQDKLRSISGLEDATEGKIDQKIADTPPTPHGSLSKYSEEEIADNVFLQGPLSYKRRSIPERTGPPLTNGRYIGSVVDRRGFSSDSEDSDNESTPAPLDNAIHRRVAELQTKGDPHKKLTSVNSVDSTTSWCSCEEPDDDDDEIGLIDTFASQIKGSPTIHNPRMRNFKRKNSKNVKEETPASAPAENDLFFDFDVECFSPVNLDDDGDDGSPFDTAQLHFISEDVKINGDEISDGTDTGQLHQNDIFLTHRSPPAKEGLQQSFNTVTNSDSPCIDLEEELKDNATLHDLDVNEVERSLPNEASDSPCVDIGDVKEKITLYDFDVNSLSKDTCEKSDASAVGNVETEGKRDTDQAIESQKDIEEAIEKHETEINEKDLPVLNVEISVHDLQTDSTEKELPSYESLLSYESQGIEVSQTERGENEEQQCSCDENSVSEAVEAVEGFSETLQENDEANSEEVADPCRQSQVLDVRENMVVPPINVSEVSCDVGQERVGLLFENIRDESVFEDKGRLAVPSTTDSAETASSVISDCGSNDSDDIVITPRMKLRRCSSLKSWKTPPGTPGRKKFVRFADALGLDLADVRTFLDEVPKVPISAFDDLNCDPVPAPPPPAPERTLLPMFQQPGMQVDFLQKVRQNHVSLESAILTDLSLLAISGIIRVRNLSFHKSVHVRYSKDSWLTFADLQTTYVPGSSDGFADNFSFTLYGHTLNIGDRLEFAIRYDCAAGQFWDNNGGANYVFQCMPRGPVPLFPPLGSSPVDSWGKFY